MAAERMLNERPFASPTHHQAFPHQLLHSTYGGLARTTEFTRNLHFAWQTALIQAVPYTAAQRIDYLTMYRHPDLMQTLLTCLDYIKANPFADNLSTQLFNPLSWCGIIAA